MVDQPPAAPSTEDIRAWVLDRVAYYLECPVSDIDPEAEFAVLGLSSLEALPLSADIEDQFNTTVDPVLAWDYPTVNAIVGYLDELLSR